MLFYPTLEFQLRVKYGRLHTCDNICILDNNEEEEDKTERQALPLSVMPIVQVQLFPTCAVDEIATMYEIFINSAILTLFNHQNGLRNLRAESIRKLTYNKGYQSNGVLFSYNRSGKVFRIYIYIFSAVVRTDLLVNALRA